MMSVKTGFKMYFTLSNFMDIGISSEVPIIKYHYSLETSFIWGQKGVLGVWGQYIKYFGFFFLFCGFIVFP